MRMNRSQLLDPDQQKKGVRGREEDISGETEGKDGSVTTYNPTHPPKDHQQRINGSVLGVDNIGRARERDPVPTKMTTNVTTPPIYAISPFPDKEEKPKGTLKQEEEHNTNGDCAERQPMSQAIVIQPPLQSLQPPLPLLSLPPPPLPPPPLPSPPPPPLPPFNNVDPSKDEPLSNFLGGEKNSTDKKDDAFSNSFYSSNVPRRDPDC